MTAPLPSPATAVARTLRLPDRIISAAILLGLAGGALGLVTETRSAQAELETRLTWGVGQAQQAVRDWEERELARLQQWVADPSMLSAADNVPATLASLAKNAAETEGIVAVALFSPQGVLRASTAPRLLTDPMLGQRLPAIQRARAGTASVAGPIRPTATTDGSDARDWLLVSAAPVLDATGETSGVLVLFFDLGAPLQRVVTALGADLRAHVHLVDDRGVRLTAGSNAGATGRRVVGTSGAASPLNARVAFELAEPSASASLPIPLGYLLAGLLACTALLVVFQQRGMHQRLTEARADQQELVAVMESVPDAVLVSDALGMVTRANRRAAQLLNAPAGTLEGTSLARWISTGTPFREEAVDAWLAAGAREAKGRRADGDDVPVEVRVGSGESERHRIHVVTLREGSARHGVERELRDARGEAERARAAQTAFLGVMGQEMRTPMSRVLGMAHLLKDTSLSGMQQHYVESLMRSAQLMMTFVSDVLDLSKIESGTLQLIDAPFDVRAAVQEVTELCRPQAEASGTALDTRIAERTPVWAVGDVGRFRQVLINLVGNGIKFAPSGRVEVRVDGSREDRDVTLKVSVRDNGPGMDPETRRRLLTKDHTTVSKLAGAGLGISMAKHLVELMRGKLEVKSLQGEGTSFLFTVVLRAAEGVDTPGAPHATVLAGTRALVVDRTAEETKVTREWLRSFGMRVETTTTPEEAIGHLRRAAAEGDPVEIALVDRQTLGEHGDAFARRLRAEPAISGVGLLLAIPGTTVSEADRLGATGCDAVLAKPFSPQALSRTLAAVVQRPRDERGRGPLICGESLAPFAPRAAGGRIEGQIAIMEEPSARSTPASRPVEDARLRVLLAEDNRVNQIVATNLLQRLDCRVDVVSDGAEAVRQASRHAFDVIFMDIQMPLMDGVTATGLIRRLPEPHARAHVVAMGTSASPEERDRYLAAGMDDVVIKPITPEVLQAALERRPAGMERIAESVGAR